MSAFESEGLQTQGTRVQQLLLHWVFGRCLSPSGGLVIRRCISAGWAGIASTVTVVKALKLALT